MGLAKTGFLKNKNVAIIGCCGTVGSELINQLVLRHNPKSILGIDNNESKLFLQGLEFQKHENLSLTLTDIRHQEGLIENLRNIDIVFHAAALKHVALCEQSPREAVQTNIIGVQNLITAATINKVEKVILTSSDKAVNPTNVMGASKLMGERLFVAANAASTKTHFCATRFGNVIGSRGSVVPIFFDQIMRGGPVTLTSPDMTRFIMTIPQSAELVLNSAALCSGGEVLISKMRVVNIQDLANAMIELYAPKWGHDPAAIKLETIGVKPGEKEYEELLSSEEVRRSREYDDYFMVLPAFKYSSWAADHPNGGKPVFQVYTSHSETKQSIDEIKDFLVTHKVYERFMAAKVTE